MTRTLNARLRTRALALSTVAVLATGLTACGASSDNGADSERDANVVNSAPAAEGAIDVLNWGVPFGEPPTVDPIAGGDSSANLIKSNVCESLFRLNADYTTSPALAESAEYSDDNLTLTIKIRTGVKFSNGNPMTAEDVRFSLARNLDPKLASTWASSVYGNVKSVSAEGEDTVVVAFNAPDSLFVNAMAITAGLVSEKASVEKAGGAYGTANGGLMCTGPYAIETWRSGSGMTLSANPHYWDDNFMPHAKTVKLKFITEASALVQGLQSGSLDGSWDVPPGSMDSLREAGNVYQGNSPQMLQIYPTAGPMDDVKLRQAVNLLVDRQAIAEKVYHGTAVPMYTFVPELLWGEGADALQTGLDDLDKPEAVDVEGAQELVDSMDNAPSELTVAIISGHEQMRLVSALLQEALKKVDITLNIKPIQPAENVAYFTDPAARAGVDLIMNTGWSAVPDYLFYARRVVDVDGRFNLLGYDNSKVSELVSRAAGMFDEPERSETFAEAQAIYTPEVPLIPVVNPLQVSFVRDGLGGLTTSFAYVYHPSLATVGATE